MARRGRRERLPLNADINVVSLIDVMLMLMVIFMITAPLMQGGVDIKLPKADVSPLASKSGLSISIAGENEIYYEKTKLTMSAFRASFAALSQGKTKNGVYLLADRKVPFEVVMQVMAIMKRAGVDNIGLMAQQEERPPGGGS